MYCCPSRSSSGRSRASGSGTRSPLSKKKGMWTGGVVPLGYRVEDRALHIVEDHAEIVRSLFRRYLEAGSVVRLKQQLDAEGVRLPVRTHGAGRSTGGGL